MSCLFRDFSTGWKSCRSTEPSCGQFASIRLDLRSKGQLIGDSDILIAATAIHHELILLTNNARHFKRIDKLQLNRLA
jgi:tRNA(fMet)-specific endonuclease VapC